MDSVTDDGFLCRRVSPFGNLRIDAYVPLPGAYRSLSRPSSAPDAKAFPLRSFSLNLLVLKNYAGSIRFFSSVEIVTHVFHNCFKLYLLLPCLSFALCSVFNVQMVGQSGLEPPTSRLSVVCSSQLSYWPVVSADLTGFASAVGLRRCRKFASVRSCFFKSKQPFRFECEGNRVMDLTLYPLN